MMFTGDHPPTLDEQNLIRSLEIKFAKQELSQPKVATQNIPTRNISGHGSISDNIRMIGNYVCSCGEKTHTVDHRTSSDFSGNVLDSYQLNCGSCGQEEKVNFQMLRSELVKSNDIPHFIERSRLHPYL